MKYITRPILILSLVSLFTDTASEMLYPILPIYLETIGFSIIGIGILEGLAEATAGISKGYFGKLSDVTGRRLPFVQLGYGLSAISKPIMGLLPIAGWIFFSRTLDRIGKGLRTGARDAMLSDQSLPGYKASVFGFHRSMDTLGAVIGPSIALLYLYFFPTDYKTLFFIAFVPGLLAIVATFLLQEKRSDISKAAGKTAPFFSFVKYWKHGSVQYRQLVAGLLIFTLLNSSDVFLILKAKQSGLPDTLVVGIYIFYNLIYAISAFPAGVLADKFGLKLMFLIGLIFFVITYGGMIVATTPMAFAALFFCYGVYAAFTEGISKAWIVSLADKKDTATAIGFYAGFQSICALLASTVAGILWNEFGSIATFGFTAGGTFILLLYFYFVIKRPG